VETVDFSPDGRRLLTATWSTAAGVKLWSTSDGRLLLTLGPDSPQMTGVAAAAFTIDARFVVTLHSDGGARFWNSESGELATVIPSKEGGQFLLSLYPDGRRMLTAGWGGRITVWDVSSGQPVLSFDTQPGSNAVSMHPDGRRLVTVGYDHAVRLWDAQTGEPMHRIGTHSGPVEAVSFAPDGCRIVTAGADNVAKVWSLDEPREAVFLGEKSEGTGDVAFVVFTPNGRQLVAGEMTQEDGVLRVWDLGIMAERIAIRVGARLNSVSLAQDRALAAVGTTKGARVFDLETGEMARQVGTSSKAVCAAISPDGRRVLTIAPRQPGDVELWGTATGERQHVLRNGLSVGDFSPDGGRMVFGRWEMGRTQAAVHDVATGDLLLTLNGYYGPVTALAFSPSGDRIVSASTDSTARIWSATSGVPLAVCRGHGGTIKGVAFSADGRRLVTGGLDNAAKVWDAKTGRLLLTLRGARNAVSSCAFSPDSRWIATTGWGHSAALWEGDDWHTTREELEARRLARYREWLTRRANGG